MGFDEIPGAVDDVPIGVAADRVGVRLEYRDRLGEEPGGESVVIGQKGDEIAARLLDPAIDRSRFAAVLGADATRHRGERLDHAADRVAVLRSIVNHDGFEVAEALARQARQGRGQQGGPVEGRDHDADARPRGRQLYRAPCAKRRAQQWQRGTELGGVAGNRGLQFRVVYRGTAVHLVHEPEPRRWKWMLAQDRAAARRDFLVMRDQTQQFAARRGEVVRRHRRRQQLWMPGPQVLVCSGFVGEQHRAAAHHGFERDEVERVVARGHDDNAARAIDPAAELLGREHSDVLCIDIPAVRQR